MEPITIIGTAGAVANIIDLVGKTIRSLREIHDRWKDADLTIINLISQLNSLKAALDEISEWIYSDLSELPQYHQLILDLEDSVTCCRMLTESMDAQVSKLDWNAENSLDLGSKIRVVFENKVSKDFQRFIKRQTSALTLLLTAFHWYASFMYGPSALAKLDPQQDHLRPEELTGGAEEPGYLRPNQG